VDGSSNGLISGGGIFWTGGLNFTVSAATYFIGGISYSSPQTNLSLSTADATNDRIDIIAVNSVGAAVIITGTPNAVPVAPDTDPSTQLQLTFAYVPAAATTPSGVTNESLYLENTEYTSSTNAATHFNLASTTNPFAGTKDIEATNAANGDYITLVKPSGSLNLSLFSTLTFYIRSKATWASPKSLSIFWLNGTTVVGVPVAVKGSGTFGFDSSVTSSYQQITIQITSFATSTTLADRLRIAVAGGSTALGFYIDNIVLQAGAAGSGGGVLVFPTRATVTFASASTATLAQATGTITVAKMLNVIKVVSNNSHPVRIRLYSSLACRTADLNRSRFVGPALYTQHEVIMDLVLNDATGYSWIMSPVAPGASADGTTTLYYTIDNFDTSTQSLSVTLTYLKAE
jgi:hypothetical protein